MNFCAKRVFLDIFSPAQTSGTREPSGIVSGPCRWSFPSVSLRKPEHQVGEWYTSRVAFSTLYKEECGLFHLIHSLRTRSLLSSPYSSFIPKGVLLEIVPQTTCSGSPSGLAPLVGSSAPRPRWSTRPRYPGLRLQTPGYPPASHRSIGRCRSCPGPRPASR